MLFTRRADCRKIQADVAAGRCDKHTAKRYVSTHSQRRVLATRNLHIRILQRAWFGPTANAVLVQQLATLSFFESASAAAWALVRQYDRASGTDLHGKKLGWHRSCAVGFRIRSDISFPKLRWQSPIVANKWHLADPQHRHQRKHGVDLIKSVWSSPGKQRNAGGDLACVERDDLMIAIGSVAAANIEVRQHKSGSSLIMNRSDMRTRVVLYCTNSQRCLG